MLYLFGEQPSSSFASACCVRLLILHTYYTSAQQQRQAASIGPMKLPSPSTKAAAVVTASVSAALATIALRSFHRCPAATAGHSAADLPDLVGGVLASSADHRPPDHRPLGWGRRALVELDLEPPLPRVEELGNDVVGAGARFPALEGSTVMFLHIFKCAGSTLRCGRIYFVRLGGFWSVKCVYMYLGGGLFGFRGAENFVFCPLLRLRKV